MRAGVSFNSASPSLEMREILQEILNRAQEWVHQRRRRLATWGVGMFTCVVAFHVLFGANGLVVYGEKRSESRQLREQVESLKLQNEQISRQIRSLRSDPKTIEREARQQLKYVRPGEMVYTVPVKPEGAPGGQK